MSIDRQQLRRSISDMYGDVARYPRGDFHFCTGRSLMELLGYSPALLDQVPTGALQSFAGVGHHLELAPIQRGELVLDLGSGTGSDVFCASLAAGPAGRAVGLEMTAAMLQKASENQAASGLSNVEFVKGYVEEPPFEPESFDCVMSNGVVNLTPDKGCVFAAVRRLLKPGGRFMFSDIVTGVDLPASVRENCELWAECIGGALEQTRYLKLIEHAGLSIDRVHRNERYEFKGQSTREAAQKFQVRSLSILAYRRP
jgi:arsenite methyltransferase